MVLPGQGENRGRDGCQEHDVHVVTRRDFEPGGLSKKAFRRSQSATGRVRKGRSVGAVIEAPMTHTKAGRIKSIAASMPLASLIGLA